MAEKHEADLGIFNNPEILDCEFDHVDCIGEVVGSLQDATDNMVNVEDTTNLEEEGNEFVHHRAGHHFSPGLEEGSGRHQLEHCDRAETDTCSLHPSRSTGRTAS